MKVGATWRRGRGQGRRDGDGAVEADVEGGCAIDEGAIGQDGIGDAVADDRGVVDQVVDVADVDRAWRSARW